MKIQTVITIDVEYNFNEEGLKWINEQIHQVVHNRFMQNIKIFDEDNNLIKFNTIESNTIIKTT